MSEPIHTTGRAKQGNISALLIEMPTDPVGVKMVPHHITTVEGSIARTGKIEVRFDGSSLPTRNDKRRTIQWEKVAYNVAQQMAYYRQVHDNLTARAEEYERKYTTALRDYNSTSAQLSEAKVNIDRLSPIINAALRLSEWWGYFLLPKSFKKHVTPE